MLPVHERQSGVVQVQKATRVRYWVIVFAATLAVITYIDRVALSFAAPFISKDLGLDSRHMGLAFTAFGVAYAAFEIPGGYLGDRLGPRSVLMRIVLWWSFFTAATGSTFNFISIATTQFFFGAGEAGCFPNLTKTFTIWLPSKERVRAQGIMWLSARWGGAFTPPLVALVMGLVGWRHTFQIFGGLGVIWAVIFYRWYRNNPLDNPKLNEAERELVRTASANARPHGDVPWGRFVTSRQVWMLCLQYFCLSYGWYFYITWLPTYLGQARHLDVKSVAIFGIAPLFMGGLGNLASVFIAGRLAPWVGSMAQTRRIMAYIGFTGASMFLLLSTQMNDPADGDVVYRPGQFLQRSGDARRLGGLHGRRRQARGVALRDDEYVGQRRRGDLSGGDRLHPLLVAQQLEPDLLCVGGHLPDGHRVLEVFGPGDAVGKIRNIQESLKKPSIGSIWCCGLSRILPFQVSQSPLSY